MVRLRVCVLLILSGALREAAPAQMVVAPVFEVASVRESKPGDGGRMLFEVDGCTIRNMTLVPIISSAFGVRRELMFGLPAWVDTMRFDIEAKEDEATIAEFAKLTAFDRYARQMVMMQALLADRFQLKAEKVVKILPDYEIVVAKGGLKIKEADPANDYANGIKMRPGFSGKGVLQNGNDQLTGQGVALKQLAASLSNYVGRTVLDKTGLMGKYDFKLRWNGDETKESELPGIFTAMEEQLGLKLVAGKGPSETLVVSGVEKPGGN